MDLKIKKKERKKCFSGLTLSGLACLPPPAPPLPFHLGRGPVLSPTLSAHYPSPALGWPRAKTKFQLLLGYIDVEAVIFDKTFSDGLLPSHNNSIYRHKFANVCRLPKNYILWRSLVPLCDKRKRIVIYSSDSLDFMMLETFASYYDILYDNNFSRHEDYCHRRKDFL